MTRPHKRPTKILVYASRRRWWKRRRGNIQWDIYGPVAYQWPVLRELSPGLVLCSAQFSHIHPLHQQRRTPRHCDFAIRGRPWSQIFPIHGAGECVWRRWQSWAMATVAHGKWLGVEYSTLSFSHFVWEVAGKLQQSDGGINSAYFLCTQQWLISTANMYISGP